MNTTTENNQKLNLNIRLSKDTRILLDRLSEKSNCIYEGENKVKNDLILNFSLQQLFDSKSGEARPAVLKELRRQSRTVDDDWEVWEQIYAKASGDDSKKGFKGFTMTDEWAAFMKKHRSTFESQLQKAI